MDFVVKKSDLLTELQYVQSVVERRTTVPILSNLLLETTGNSLSVTATDLDVTVQCFSPAEIKVSGAVTVSARKLIDIVRLLPEADIHFKAGSQDWINVTCQRSRFKLAVLSKDNFPEVPAVNVETVTLPAAALRYMIHHTIFAITQEESRYTLNGALLLLQPNKLTCVTTDGHRLALITHDCKIEGIAEDVRVLVPKKTLSELSKLSSEEIEIVEFGNSENHLFFRVGDRLLVSRILTGQFPNYEMVIPKGNDREVSVGTTEFSDALRRVAVMADEESHSVRFAFSAGQVDISSVSAEFGEAKESLPADYQGDQLEIGFNARYLLDFLAVLETERVLLQLRDQETQGLFRPSGSDAFDYYYVVMPMKI